MSRQDNDIAIIGMSARTSAGDNLAALWQVLQEGAEAHSSFSDADLRAAGVPAPLLGSADLVRRRPVMHDVDKFDADFFGYTPREAETLDPQQRIFLECAWEALEGAGCDPDAFDGSIGVFGGSGFTWYLLSNLYANRGFLDSVGMFPALLGNEKDFLAPRVSYKLNLRGPSVNVVTGCSSSLVAVHLACQSLLSGESDLALAGGACIYFPQQAGYLFQEGSVNSPDGHCRAFDVAANGTVPGDGVGVVLLKPLQAALADGDPIHGIIKGTAVNNDGSAKAGFTAPSVQGQAAVISEALAVADVTPESVTYVEAHGTGTRLGDAIEIAALTEAFGATRRGYCRIGTSKPNIGHTDTAAGVLGLIKIVLAFAHETIPGCTNLETVNPELNLEQTPFYLSNEPTPWPRQDRPRRAAVSSFSVGGTNAHAILEEPPVPKPSGAARRWQILPISAKTPAAVGAAADQLAAALSDTDPAALADVAYTLQTRHSFSERRAVVCDTAEAAVTTLTATANRPHTSVDGDPARIAFLFPGQGSQYTGMAKELYESEPVFRRQMDLCADRLRPVLGRDLRNVLYPAADSDAAGSELDQTWLTQPALFATELAVATMLGEWGITPSAMLGHSIGELVAATVSGVFAIEDALLLVAARGRLIQDQPPGAMLAVALPETEAVAAAGADVSIAAINGPRQTVLAGTDEAISTAAKLLAEQGIQTAKLTTSRAFHSRLVDDAARTFTDIVAKYPLGKPRVPFLSNVTGTWITDEQATDPGYWGRQLRQPVRFSAGLSQLLAQSPVDLVEVGPGDTLRRLVAQQPAADPARPALTTLPRTNETKATAPVVADTLAHLWLRGHPVDWRRLSGGEQRRIVTLPTYPFQRRRFWVEPSGPMAGTASAPSSSSADAGRTPTDTTATAEPAKHQRSNTGAFTPPRNDTERVVASVWEEVIGITPVGAHDDFFDLGGHSLLAAQIVSRLQQAYPITLTVADLLTATPSVAAMAATVEAKLLSVLDEMSDDDARRLLTSDQEARP